MKSLSRRLPKIVLRPRNGKLKSSSTDELSNDLASLSRIINGSKSSVLLVGGVGMAIRNKLFYRNHHDLDLALFTDDLEEFFNHMEEMGYQAVNRHFSMHISPWHNMQAVSPISSEQLRNMDPAKLRIRIMRKRNAFFFASSRTDYIDIFFLGKCPQGVILHGYDAIVPWNDFFPLEKSEEHFGFQMPNLNYKKYLPPTNSRQEKDFKNAGIIPGLPEDILESFRAAQLETSKITAA